MLTNLKSAKAEEIDYDKLYIFDIYANNKISLKKCKSGDNILKLMIANWIPYIECHKCGKWDYCKYVKVNSVNPNKAVDIKCGVAIDFLTNYIKNTFEKVKKLEINKLQSYLNSAYYLTQYVLHSEWQIGSFINNDYQEYLGNYSPMIFGQTKRIREFLEKAHHEMKEVDFFHSKQSILFVEGNSEKIFLEGLKKTNLVNFDILVEDYGGEGRIRYAKVEHHFKSYESRGYTIYLQTDLDGKSENSNTQRIISSGLIDEENIFEFKFDFETSILIKLLYTLLLDNNFIEDSFENFDTNYKRDISIVKYLEANYSLSSFPKVLIAEKLATRMVAERDKWLNNEKFFKTELGNFLRFIEKNV
jgi:hypothetical protein